MGVCIEEFRLLYFWVGHSGGWLKRCESEVVIVEGLRN